MRTIIRNNGENSRHMQPVNVTMETDLELYDVDRDGRLNREEFTELCKNLFKNKDLNRVYDLNADLLDEVFNVFDRNSDGYLDRDEFQFCWNNWIRVIKKPVSALLIVDVQNDFIAGSLNLQNCPAGQNGAEVIEPINELLRSVNFDAVFYSLDWHPENHISFFENLKLRKLHESCQIRVEDVAVYDEVVFEGNPAPVRQKLWPRHCVQNSWGSQTHDNFEVKDYYVKILKGTNPEVDSYSAFFDNDKRVKTELGPLMIEKQVSDVYLCGLAHDVCVGASALDSLNLGFRTILIEDCCRGLDHKGIDQTNRSILEKHGCVVNSKDVKAMVEGRDRKFELGYKLATKFA